MNTDPDRYVILGQVVGVFGIKGWVKIRSETDPPRNILNYSTWYLSKDNDWQAHELVQGQQHNKGLIAQLAGCEDRDTAASLVGNRIAILRTQLPELPKDEYYWSDLIGLKVYNLDKQFMGVVDHLLETGANDVLVIKAEKGEILVPYVRDYYVQSIDLDAGCITVDWEESEE